MSVAHLSLSQLNNMDRIDFSSAIGWVYEHSQWVADRAWERRPFETLADLHTAMDKVVKSATPEERMSLIQAHPDLAGRLAKERKLTAASTNEQAHAGLNELTAAVAREMSENNARYREKFGFPFIVCVRLNNIGLIREAFVERLQNNWSEEVDIALREISKIAGLRLADMIA